MYSDLCLFGRLCWLFSAGLGVKKIKLDLQDDEQMVLNRITSDEKDADGIFLHFLN